MTNPFDDPDGTYVVLVNDEGQHCLWPATTRVPAGWSVGHGPAGRDACADHVKAHWTDLRPRSLAAALSASPAPPASHASPASHAPASPASA
jgi:MbtH protein